MSAVIDDNCATFISLAVMVLDAISLDVIVFAAISLAVIVVAAISFAVIVFAAISFAVIVHAAISEAVIVFAVISFAVIALAAILPVVINGSCHQPPPNTCITQSFPESGLSSATAINIWFAPTESHDVVEVWNVVELVPLSQ